MLQKPAEFDAILSEFLDGLGQDTGTETNRR